MTTDEREDWQNLMGHPGFLRLSTWARNVYKDDLLMHVGHAANERDDVMALNKLRQVIAAKNAVENVLSYPAERLAQLAAQKIQADAPATMSRRGTL